MFPRPEIKRPLPSKEDDISEAIAIPEADEDVLDTGLRQESVDGKTEADEVGDAIVEMLVLMMRELKVPYVCLMNKKNAT